MTKSIAFVVGSKIQWENLLSICPSLIKIGYEPHFVSLDNYGASNYKTMHINEGFKLRHTVLERLPINNFLTILFKRRFFRQFLPLFSLKHAWRKWLKNNKPHLVVFGVDHSSLNSYMIYVCKQYGIKTAVLQDAYIPTQILGGKLWKNLLDRFRIHFNCYLPYTPEPFRSGVEFIGLIGTEAKKYMELQLPKYSQIIVVGLPRIETFAKRYKHVNDILKASVNSHNRQKDKIVFIHTVYSYGNAQPKPEYQQQMALIWLCEIIQSMNWQENLCVEVVLHTGTPNIGEYNEIQKRFKDIMVLHEGGINLSSMKSCHFCFSFNSTGLFDFLYAGVSCGVLSSPETRKPIQRGLLEFGLPHIKSKDQLIDVLTQNADHSNISVNKYTLRNKIANFEPNWNAIDKTSDWIVSLMSK